MTDGDAGNATVGASGEAPIQHTHIGGQALLEGVMMRGKLNWAVAVRTPDGSIHLEEHDLPADAQTGWRKVPLLRGMWAMWETLSLSLKAFAIAARFMDVGGDGVAEPDDVAAPAAPPRPTSSASLRESEPPGASTPSGGLTSNEIAFTMVLGVGFAVLVFIVLPAFLTNLVVSSIKTPLLWNVVDGVLRLVVFVAYIAIVGLVPDIRRVFAYHGAEHKTIHAYEHGVPLEPAYIQRYSTMHVRCGTSFLLMVMIVAILVFSLVPGRAILGAWGVTSSLAVVLFNIGVRILLLPLVAGIAYEVTVKWAGRHPDNPLVKVLLWPGMQLQRFTTREPDDGMVEVAVAALRAVEERERAAGEMREGVSEPT